jgi:WD40 repeat protein
VISSTFSPNGKVSVTSSYDKYVRLWNIRTSPSSQILKRMSAEVIPATFHPNGLIIGSALKNGTFSIIETRNQQISQTYKHVHTKAITSLQFHPGAAFALTASADNKICIWNFLEEQLFCTIAAYQAPFSDGR